MTPEEALALGEQIRRRRERRGLTQKHVAEHVGVSPATLGRWERGIIGGGRPAEVPADRLDALTDALGCTRDALLDAAKISDATRDAHLGLRHGDLPGRDAAAARALGRAIAHRRSELGLTQGQLAFTLGVPQHSVVTWERGWATRPRSPERVVATLSTRRRHAIADALKCEPADLDELARHLPPPDEDEEKTTIIAGERLNLTTDEVEKLAAFAHGLLDGRALKKERP